MGARGSEIRPISGIPHPPKWREMTVVAPGDQPDTPGEAHGKEGVNGSSPLEGFLRSRGWAIRSP
jgi:hypothetical protein